ncbi:MAG: hypothetical protein MI748_02095 [Opitutales bacterium]|nr:hypothetical protein [Opitutales bacterium]
MKIRLLTSLWIFICCSPLVFADLAEEFEISPLRLSAEIEDIVIKEIENGPDLTISDIGRRGIGSEYSVELKEETITITFIEDFDKSWAKTTIYTIEFQRRKHVFGKTNQRSKLTINSFVKGLKIPMRFTDLETHRMNQIKSHNKTGIETP